MQKKSFDAWCRAVESALVKLCGMSMLDLPDMPYRDWYEDGWTPREAAKSATRDAF